MQTGSDERLHSGLRHHPLHAAWTVLSRPALAAVVISVVGLGGTVLPGAVAGAATQTVTNCGSSGTGSLPQAVLDAASGDTIAFDLSPSCPIITLKGTLDLNVDVTVDGPGASTLTIDELPYVNVFDVASGVTATISGLTIENGSSTIDNLGTVTVTGSTLSGSGSSAGGSIINDGTLTVTDSTLSGNGVTSGAGAGGGAIENNDGNATVTGSILSDNTASVGANGGAVDNNGGSVSISGSTLSGDDATEGSGGGIVNQDGGTVTITTSSLVSDSAVDGTGGAVYNQDGTVTITDSTISRNTSFYGDGGGAIFNASSLVVANSTLNANGANYGGDGGAINNSGTLTLTGSTLYRNSSTDDGGGIFDTGTGTSTVASTILANSVRGDCSGPIVDGGYNLDDDDSCGFTAATDISNAPADLDPEGLLANGGPTKTIALEAGSPAIGAVTSAALCSTPDQRGVARPTPCDIGAVELALPPEVITSADHASAKVGKFFSFQVTTSGQPVPSIRRSGHLPKHLVLTKNDDGTATLSGTPDRAGVYPLTFAATYGTGPTKSVVTQAFTLTVAASS
jgi:hypothetical protein